MDIVTAVAIETSYCVADHIDIAIGVNGDVIISIYISSSDCRVNLLKSCEYFGLSMVLPNITCLPALSGPVELDCTGVRITNTYTTDAT